MRIYYRRGGKGAAPEGFDRVYTEVDGSGSILRELLAYVRAGDSVTVEMVGELGGTAGAFVEMALALYQRQATLLCKSPKIDTAAGHWQAVFSDLATLTGRNTDDAARLSRFMEELHRCFDLVERRQMTVLDKLILEDHNSQDVLSFIVGELEELEGMDIMNAPYAPLDM